MRSAQVVEGELVRGEDGADVERLQGFERAQEVAERVAAGPSGVAQVRRDDRQDVVAAEQQPALALVEADVAGGVARRRDDFPAKAFALDDFAAFE